MARKESKNNLGLLLQSYLEGEKRSLRDLAAEIGTSHSTLARLTHGHEPDATTLLKLWTWMLKTEEP